MPRSMLESCCEGSYVCALSAEAPQVEERDARVLAALAEDADGHVAFSGLKRSLDLHQQILARTLKRLARDGLVAKEAAGYRLTDGGYAALCASGVELSPPAPRETLTVVQAVLPPTVTPKQVADALAGRWFRGLRWHGRVDGPGETALVWTNGPERTRLVVRVAGATVAVDVETASADDPGAFAAVRGVLQALAEAYAAPVPPGAPGERPSGTGLVA